jgi:hypothetical protein
MFRDHPLLGVGPDNFRWRFESYSGVAADNLGIHAHNQYLEALADTGLLGLVSLGWLLVSLVRVAVGEVRTSRYSADWPWRAALLASLCAWLVHALLDDFERFWPASVAFWLLAGLNLRRACTSDGVADPVAQPPYGVDQTLGCVAFAHEGGDTGPQRLVSLLGPPAESQQAATGAGMLQFFDATRTQPWQPPIEQNHAGLSAQHLCDEPVGRCPLADDGHSGLVFQ